MRTADAVQMMVLMADERVMAAMRRYVEEFVNPLLLQTMEIMERHDLRQRIGKLLRVNEL